MTFREWVDAGILDGLHKPSTSPDFYTTWTYRAARRGRQIVHYLWDHADWEFKHKSANITVTANSGAGDGPSDMSVEGPHGGLFVSGQKHEIVWVPARYIMQDRELTGLSGSWPETYTVFGQSSTYTPSLKFDRTTHDAFTGVLYYLRKRPLLYYVKAPGACTAALAGLGAGNVNSGAHTYQITFVTASGETEAGTTSNSVTTTAGNGQVALTSIPLASVANGVSDPSVVTSRRIYRTAAGGTQHKLLATLSDNTTTTYADNIADASLTTNAPTTDTTGEDLKLIPEEYHESTLLPGLEFVLRSNVNDQRAEVTDFPLFTTALAKMKSNRIFGQQDEFRFGDAGYPTLEMW